MGPLFSWSFIESMQHENISFATDEKYDYAVYHNLFGLRTYNIDDK